jgi:hypothetical protein
MRRLIDCRGRRGRGDDVSVEDVNININLRSSSRMAHGGAHHGFFAHIYLATQNVIYLSRRWCGKSCGCAGDHGPWGRRTANLLCSQYRCNGTCISRAHTANAISAAKTNNLHILLIRQHVVEFLNLSARRDEAIDVSFTRRSSPRHLSAYVTCQSLLP